MLGDAWCAGSRPSRPAVRRAVDRRETWLLHGDSSPSAGRPARAASPPTIAASPACRSTTRTATRRSTRSRAARARRTRSRSCRAAASSGLYDLAHQSIVENSEIVSSSCATATRRAIIMRPRRSARVHRLRDGPAGRAALLFREPVPALDADLNPVSIRIHLRAARRRRSGVGVRGDGARARGHGVEIGGTYVDDHRRRAPARLARRHGRRPARAQHDARGRVRAHHGAGPVVRGGGRIEIRQDTRRTRRAILFGAVTDDGFTNPSAGFSPGRAEGGLRINTRVAMRTRQLADGLYTGVAGRTAARAAQRSRPGAPARRCTASSGCAARSAGATGPGAPNTLALRDQAQRAGAVAAQPRRLPEYEQDLPRRDRRLAAVGGEYRLNTRGRLHARHEFRRVEPGGAVDAQRHAAPPPDRVRRRRRAEVARETRVFSEYRLADALTTRARPETAVGCATAGDSPTATARAPRSRAAADAERAVGGSRRRRSPDRLRRARRIWTCARVGPARRCGAQLARQRLVPDEPWRRRAGWTRAWCKLLGRQLASVTMDHARGTTVRDRLQIGLAHRPARAGDGTRSRATSCT